MWMHEQSSHVLKKEYLFSHEEKNLFEDKLSKSNEMERHSAYVMRMFIYSLDGL